MAKMEYDLGVKHFGTDSGDLCLHETYDGQMDDIRPLVWSIEAEGCTTGPDRNDISPDKTEKV